MDKEFKLLIMESLKDNLLMIEYMGMENLNTIMAILTKANGKMIRKMAKEIYSIKMARYIKEILKMMLKKDKDCKLGQMVHNM